MLPPAAGPLLDRLVDASSAPGVAPSRRRLDLRWPWRARPAAQRTRQPRPGGNPTCADSPGRTMVGTTPVSRL
jgi:hypothetical protein